MKKTLAMLLALCMVFALCACGGSTAPAAPAATVAPEEIPDAAALVSDAFIDPLADWSKYDDLIAQIKSETDFAKRTELMHQAEDILMATNCVIPIYYYNDDYMQKPFVDGIYANLFGFKYFMFSTLSNGADSLRINLA